MKIKERKHDARRLRSNELTELRCRGVEAVQAGESPEVVARVMGISRATIYNWLALYRSGGWNALDAKKRGGRRPKLGARELAWLYRAITTGNPRQYKFEFALWSAKMIGMIIKQRWGISLSKSSVCRLLNQLGITPQRPLWRAYQQDPKMVEKWKKEDYPRIKKEAKKQGASIWFADEAGVQSSAHAGTTWAIKGQTPIIKTTGGRFGLNIISAVTARGDFRFMCYQGGFNSSVLMDFLQRLLKGAEHPVYLILDNHPVHRTKAVKKYSEATKGLLKIFYLPAYSPELNPDELVWNDLKRNCLGRRVITGPDMLKKTVRSYLASIQNIPVRIASFFRHPDTIYAIT